MGVVEVSCCFTEKQSGNEISKVKEEDLFIFQGRVHAGKREFPGGSAGCGSDGFDPWSKNFCPPQVSPKYIYIYIFLQTFLFHTYFSARHVGYKDEKDGDGGTYV